MATDVSGRSGFIRADGIPKVTGQARYTADVEAVLSAASASS